MYCKFYQPALHCLKPLLEISYLPYNTIPDNGINWCHGRGLDHPTNKGCNVLTAPTNETELSKFVLWGGDESYLF